MKNTVTTVDVSRPFEFDELFFSLTDKSSKIQFANEVFVRISAYKTEEINDQLHKIIRHPDMPRCVFKIFWDRLENNQAVAAYVKNLAKDGKYYWVMALAYPTKSGYLSIRLKPSSKLFDNIQSIYSEVLNYEKEKENELGKRKGMYEAEKLLLKHLSDKGFDSYEEFMWEALKLEMSEREGKIDKEKAISKLTKSSVPAHRIELQSSLGLLFEKLERLTKLHEILMNHSSYMLQLAGSILLLSLNAQVGSAKLDNKDASLSVIAEKMGEQTRMGEKELQHIQHVVRELNTILKNLNFEIISSKLKVEMANDFFVESVNNDFIGSKKQTLSPQEVNEVLFESYMPDLESIIQSIDTLPKHLGTLKTQVENIKKFLQVLRFIHITGKVEIAKMEKGAKTFATTFEELITEIDSAQKMLNELSNAIYSNESTIDFYSKGKKNMISIKEELTA